MARNGKAVTVYLGDEALAALDAAVRERAEQDREHGLQGYSVTNRSKLISEIVTTYLMESREGELTFSKIQELSTPVFVSYGVVRADLFGSFARGDQGPESDIDIMIDKGPVRGLRFFNLQDDLSRALGRQVDLHAYGSNEAFEAKIAQDKVALYAV